MKGKSKWISEAVIQLLSFDNYHDLVMINNQMEGFEKLDSISVDRSFKLNLDDDWVGKVGYSRNGTSLEGKSSIFYKNLYSKYGQLLNTLDDIYYTQLFLENLGIPYLMFSIANFLTTEASFDTIQNIEKTFVC